MIIIIKIMVYDFITATTLNNYDEYNDNNNKNYGI